MFETQEWSTERAIVVRVPPPVAFALVRDHRRLPEWAPGLARVEVDDAATTFPGGRAPFAPDHRAMLRCEPEGDGTRIAFAVRMRSTGSALRSLVARAMFDVARLRLCG